MSRPRKMTPEREQILIEQYDSNPETITRLAVLFDVSRNTIKQYATRLKRSKQKEDKPWSTKEVERLKMLCRVKTLKEIAIILNRTVSSIALKLNELRIRTTSEIFTRSDLLELFGCTNWRIVCWRKIGWIQLTKYHFYSFEDIRNFCLSHPEEVERCENRNKLWISYIVNDIKDGHQEMKDGINDT